MEQIIIKVKRGDKLDKIWTKKVRKLLTPDNYWFDDMDIIFKKN